MKYRKTLLLTAFITPLLAGCGADSHTVQNGNSKYQLSARKGKDKMPTESPMLNEIFAIPQSGIALGKSINVNHIVTRYIPIGTSKKQTKQILEKLNQSYEEEGNMIYAGYRIETHPMTPKKAVRITFKYNESGFLEDVDTGLTTRF